jgi:hypothetical protein
MNFNKNQTAADILPTLPEGKHLKLAADKRDEKNLKLKLFQAQTELNGLKMSRNNFRIYRQNPDLYKLDLASAQGKVDFYAACLTTSHGVGV